MKILTSILLVILSGLTSLSAEEDRKGKIVVDFRLSKNFSDGKYFWVTRALEQNVLRDVSIYKRLLPVPKEDFNFKKCAGKLDCLLNSYNKENVDIYLQGVSDREKVHWKVFDTHTHTQINSGVFFVGKGSSLRKIKMETYRAVSPFRRKGGILDQIDLWEQEGSQKYQWKILWPYAFRLVQEYPSGTKWAFLTIITVIIALALSVGSAIKARRQSRGIVHEYQSFNILLGLFILLLLFVIVSYFYKDIVAVIGDFNPLEYYARSWAWILPLPTGIIWGIVVIKILPSILPLQRGIEQIPPKVMPSLIQTWILAAIIRLVGVLLIMVPFIMLGLSLGQAFAPDLFWIKNPLIPLFILFSWFFLGLFLDILSYSIDNNYVLGDSCSHNPWNLIIHDFLQEKYFAGEIDLDVELMESVYFLPGSEDDIKVYGGGMAPARIVIPLSTLHLAFEIDEEDFTENEFFSLSKEEQLERGKDFIIAVFLIGMGKVHRNHHRINSLLFIVRKFVWPFLGPYKEVQFGWKKYIRPVYHPFFQRSIDNYVCVYGQLDALVQYYHYQRSTEKRYLSVQGSLDDKREITNRVFDRNILGGANSLEIILGKQLNWLHKYFRSQSDDVSSKMRLSGVVIVGVCFVTFIFGLRSFMDVWNYHPVWMATIRLEQEKIDEYLEKYKKKRGQDVPGKVN